MIDNEKIQIDTVVTYNDKEYLFKGYSFRKAIRYYYGKESLIFDHIGTSGFKFVSTEELIVKKPH